MSLSVVAQGLGVLLRKAVHQLAAGCSFTCRSPSGDILSEESMQGLVPAVLVEISDRSRYSNTVRVLRLVRGLID